MIDPRISPRKPSRSGLGGCQRLSTGPGRHPRLRALAGLGAKILGVYVVGRLTLAIATPAVFLSHDWVLAFKMQCLERNDLCVAVQSQDAVVGKMWWGKAFYFTVRPGMEAQMRSYVTRNMPDSKWDRFFTPYNYIGIAFEAQQSP